MKLSYLLIPSLLLSAPVAVHAQGVIDALRLSQQDMKGTARYMSMGGAFGALGGDLTTLSQNPAGIGVYRSHEVGLTVDLDMQNANTSTGNFSTSQSQTKFLLNNIGGVLTLKLNSETVPNLNFGFTYNKDVSFNRAFSGGLGNINMSMTNWMAGVSNANEVSVGDVQYNGHYDPYNPNDGGFAAPWTSILAYQGNLIYPIGDEMKPSWQGMWESGNISGGDVVSPTTGTANYAVTEKGGVDSFNIAFGGNIANILYWGMDFDISSINYTRESFYQENLKNAWIDHDSYETCVDNRWNIDNYYNVSGTGFTYKLGFIVRPIQELRIGFAFHTPTFYSLTQQFGASTTMSYEYENRAYTRNASTNDGIPGSSDFRFATPWKVQVSAAGVIGSKFIISAEYEWSQTSKMHFSDPVYGYYGGYDPWDWDYGYDDWYNYGTRSAVNSYDGENRQISRYFGDTNTIRVGAEYRILPQLSVRAGYCHVSSPVKAATRSDMIPTAGTMADYRLDKATDYVTCGLGFRTGGFYADLAYVWKHISSEWQPYTNDPDSRFMAPKADLSLTNNQLVLSMGYKF